MLNADTVLGKSDKARGREVEGEIVLVHATTGFYYSLNETGSLFWSLLDGARTLKDCALEIAKRFRESTSAPTSDQVLSDLIALTSDLVAEGLAEAK